jgi:hypothetical protein
MPPRGRAIACAIALCMHPRPGVPPQYQSDQAIRKNHFAANREILRRENSQS